MFMSNPAILTIYIFFESPKFFFIVRIIGLGINMAHILLYYYQKEIFSPKVYFCPKCQKCTFELPASNKKTFASKILLEISKPNFNVMVRQLLATFM